MALVVAAVLAPLLVVSPRPAAACTCLERTEQELAAQADVVFTGTALTRREVVVPTTTAPALPGHVEWTFAVEGVTKGAVAGAHQDVMTASNSAACGFDFQAGARYLVYATRQDGALTTGLCSGTRLAAAVPTTVAPPTTVAGPAASPGRLRLTG